MDSPTDETNNLIGEHSHFDTKTYKIITESQHDRLMAIIKCTDWYILITRYLPVIEMDFLM